MLIVGPKCAISVVTNIKNNTVSTKIGNYIVYICNFCTNLHNLTGILNGFNQRGTSRLQEHILKLFAHGL